VKKRFQFISLKDFIKELDQNLINDSIKQIFIPDKEKTYIVALSGGPDSLFLTHIYNKFYKKKYIEELILFHFNHKIRKEADEEEEFVIGFAQQLDLPIVVSSKNVVEFCRKTKKNLEEAARILRYRDIFRLTKRLKKECFVVTGHHGDDYIETIFLRLLRGSSLKNINFFHKRTLPIKIAHKSYSLNLLSPLLLFDKTEILEYLEENRIPYKIDRSNFDESYKRNFIRKNVLEPLKRIGFKSGIVWQRTHLSTIYFKNQSHLQEFICIDRQLLNGLDNSTIKMILDQVTKSLGVSPFSSKIVAEFIYQSEHSVIKIETKECLIESVRNKIWFINQNAFLLKEPKILKEDHHWIILWDDKKRIYNYNDIIKIFYLKQNNLSKIKEILREKEIPQSIRKNVPIIIRQHHYQILLSYIKGFWDLNIPLNH